MKFLMSPSGILGGDSSAGSTVMLTLYLPQDVHAREKSSNISVAYKGRIEDKSSWYRMINTISC